MSKRKIQEAFKKLEELKSKEEDAKEEFDELKKKVWSYQSEVETHTVETHIYRLRKKILNTFNDRQFILSEKSGYQIK